MLLNITIGPNDMTSFETSIVLMLDELVFSFLFFFFFFDCQKYYLNTGITKDNDMCSGGEEGREREREWEDPTITYTCLAM